MSFSAQHGKTALAIALGMALAACGGGSAGPEGGSGSTDSRTEKGTLSTKAPTSALAGANGPIYEDPDSRKIHIRGDLLIQVLLSRVGERDAKGQPMVSWLDSDTYRSIGYINETLPLLGPAALVTEEIKPDTAQTGLGQYVAEVDLRHGPLLYPTHIHKREGDWRIRRFDEAFIQFGLSMPGMSKQGFRRR